MTKKHQTYPKEEPETLKETIQKLKSQVRNLQKKVRELKSENMTLVAAWEKAEEFLEDVTKGVPLEKLLKADKLPSKATMRKQAKVEDPDEKEKTRKKFAKWRKENL
jgi:cell division protein ZapA (FtsZ GTPase activity inhibitor)